MFSNTVNIAQGENIYKGDWEVKKYNPGNVVLHNLQYYMLVTDLALASENIDTEIAQDKWLNVTGGGSNLAALDLTQKTGEDRTYNINGRKINFSNGLFGINEANPALRLHITETGNTADTLMVENTALTSRAQARPGIVIKGFHSSGFWSVGAMAYHSPDYTGTSSFNDQGTNELKHTFGIFSAGTTNGIYSPDIFLACRRETNDPRIRFYSGSRYITPSNKRMDIGIETTRVYNNLIQKISSTLPSDEMFNNSIGFYIMNNKFKIKNKDNNGDLWDLIGESFELKSTIDMEGIASPLPDQIVFNTDVKAIYRYDLDTDSWLPLTVGYGVVSVYNENGNGVPKFFSTVQGALETCKASGENFIVKLHSNFTISNTIEIDYTGSGVGKSYLFNKLTIDFNGFKITNSESDSSNCFDFRPSNNVTVHQEMLFLNGGVYRKNGTGTHYALKFDQGGRLGTIQMSKMFWYCQNSNCANMNIASISTQQGIDRVCDLGGSTFVSQNGYGIFIDNSTIRLKNFNVISHSANYALGANSGDISYFTAENTSTGRAISVSGTVKLRHFEGYSNSGTGLFITNGIATNFYIKSVSGRGVESDIATSCTVTNFTIETGNNYALKVLGSFGNNNNFSNGKCINNGTIQCVQLQNFGSGNNIEAMNYGSGLGLDVRNNQNSRAEVTNCKGISIGGIGGYINASGAGNIVKVDNCNFVSDLNTSSGHAVWVDGSSQSLLTKCNFIVRNSGANAINATSPVTVNSRYCTHNDVAITAINANVTIVSSAIIS